MEESEALLWLSLCSALTAPQRRGWLEREGSARAAQRALARRGFRLDEQVWQRARKSKFIFRGGPDYPEELTCLHDPPDIVYYRGHFPHPDRPRIGVVGTRRATPQGMFQTARFSRALSERGLVVVSGLARGIDTAALKASLEVAGGFPLAVVACGLDLQYPLENRQLQRWIEAEGLVLSEYPPGSQPQRWHFPARNRLIAALSRLILVVEAPARSGALLTAQHAKSIGRDVLTLPGPLDHRNYQGNLGLLQDGAGLARQPRDVFDALKLSALYLDEYQAFFGTPQAWSERLGLGFEETLAYLALRELDGSVQRLDCGGVHWKGSVFRGSPSTM